MLMKSTCLQKSQRTWRNNTIKKGAQKTYKITHTYYSFYTRFSSRIWALRSRTKLILKRQYNCDHALNERRLTSWWHFHRKYRADTARKKRRTRHILVHIITPARQASFTPEILLRITTIYSFTRTRIIDKSSTIEGVNVRKAQSPKLINFFLINSCLQAGQFQ